MVNVAEIKAKGLKGSVWNFLNLLVNQLRTFIVTLILARLLTPADFGLVSMAMVLNSILDFLVDFGFSSAIVRKREITDIEVSTAFWINLILGGFCSLAVFFSAPVFAWFYGMPELEGIVCVTSWSFFISSLGTLQTALFQRELNFRKPFVARLISGCVSGLLGIGLALLGYNVWALVISNLFGWILYSFSIWFMSSWRPLFVFDIKSVSDLVSFGWKMTVSTLMNRVVRQLDTLIIGKLYSAASLGLFNRAQSLNNLVIEYSFSSIRSVMLPALSQIQNDNEALKYSVLKLLHVISFLTFFFAGIMYICAEDIILLLYGEQWNGTIEIFKVLGLSSISLCLPVVFDAVMNVSNRMNMYMLISFCRNLIVLCAIPLGIYYGFMAYVWAVSIAGIIKLVPTLFSTRSCIGLSIQLQLRAILSYVFPFTLILLLWQFCYFNTNIYIVNLMLKGSAFLIVYMIMNFAMKNEGLKICQSLLMKYIYKK